MNALTASTIPPPTPLPSQILSGLVTRTRLYTVFLEFLRPWIERVADDPSTVENIAQKLLGDTRFLYLLIMLSQDMMLRVSEDELRNIYKTVYNRFREVGIDLEDSIEIMIEHDLWKLRQIKKNFNNFISIYIDFAVKNPEDTYRYAVILTALMLLLITSIETKSLEKLKLMADEIKRLADELELYTLTLMMALEKSDEENKVVATAKNLEELKKALEIK
jgi:hypothetical protein